MITPPKIFVAVQKHKLGEWLPEQELPLHVNGEFIGEPFQVKEYEGLRFRFVSDDPDDRMVVEKFDLEIIEQFGPGESVVLTKPGDSDDMLVPGDYSIAVRTKRTSYEAFYRIEPKNIGWGQLLNLRKYLEQKLTGLSSDLLKRRGGTSEDDLEQMPSALKVYQHVQKNFNQLRHHLDSIVEDPIRDVVQVYGLRNYSRKPDAKSQRWLSKRGSAKNAAYMAPLYFNEKHTDLTEDNLENRWVNYIIRMILKSLKQLQNMFERSRSEQKSKINKKREQVTGFQARLNRIKDSYGYEKRRRELEGLITNNEREISRMSEGLMKVDDSLRELNKMITHLTRYMKTNELGKASSRLTQKKPTLRLLKDVRYASLYRLYKNIETAQSKQPLSKQTTFPYKRTSLLFEYYVLCLIIDSLKANGFIWTRGWLADEEDPIRLIGGLASETLLRFETPDGRFYIELAYDMSIINTNDDTVSHFKANINRTPDFRLAMYTSKGLFVNALIIDAKYRHHSYLWDEHEDNDVMKQLTDYLYISHRDVNKPVRSRLNREAVSKVIAVYPKQSGTKPFFEVNDKTIAFVQVEPVDPASGESAFGFDHLNQLINEYLAFTLDEELQMEVT